LKWSWNAIGLSSFALYKAMMIMIEREGKKRDEKRKKKGVLCGKLMSCGWRRSTPFYISKKKKYKKSSLFLKIIVSHFRMVDCIQHRDEKRKKKLKNIFLPSSCLPLKKIH
jgi:hypothetical protein